jgi:hypothetical protein
LANERGDGRGAMGEGIGNRKKEKKKELIKFEYEKGDCK